MGRSQLICTGGSLMVRVQYSNDYKDDKNEDCLKQASKKFGGDEKKPKLSLIADENNGGFPNGKNNGMIDTRCESKRKMKAPSLVSRLMGLESMPAGSGSNPQKDSASETWSNVVDKLGARHGESDKEDMDFKMAEIKSSEPGLQRSEPSLSVDKQSIASFLHSLKFSVSVTQHLGAASGSGFPDCELDEVLYSSKDHVLSLNLPSDNVILLDFAEIHSTISASSWTSGLLNTSISFVILFLVMVVFFLSFCSRTSQEELQMKGCDTRGGMVANVDVLTARHPVSREMESSKYTGCHAPEDPVLCINDCDFFGNAATMNMFSKYQKDMILLKLDHANLAVASSKDVVRRSSSRDESKLTLAGAVVGSVDLVSQISQVKSKVGLKKCTTCHKRVGLTGFSCKCGDLFCVVHHY
ncbi:hypothetical protein CQW23_30242 [Capsicum baccatum]|uniref:Uncharacterized protein n=1 Tax=Capsicum baccatum TaxID=33114 RepID=A0A2G2VB13_CAPBA|nr:hypothetical protein CQW23_30242 [Capsicum baccatum]